MQKWLLVVARDIARAALPVVLTHVLRVVAPRLPADQGELPLDKP